MNTDNPQTRQKPRGSRRHALHERWRAAWAPSGPLHALWEDVRTARDDGWHGMAVWLKTLLAITGGATAVLLVHAAVSTVGQALELLPTNAKVTGIFAGLWEAIDHPVRDYLVSHNQGLPIGASTIHALWLATGLACLVLGCATRNNGVRLTWSTHGAATAAMVWESSPTTGRTVATAITILAWTLASAFALRGLSLRGVLAYASSEVRLSSPPEPPVADAPGNVRALPRR
ncbi:hypothetical protein [Streptomyces ramulosus]|uniref:hypothetical protein n=1 Tax=Streptomyces TaxID=1883 RepID=UPI0031E6F175